MEFANESYIDEEGNTEVPSYIKDKLRLDKDYVVEWSKIDDQDIKVKFRKKFDVTQIIGPII